MKAGFLLIVLAMSVAFGQKITIESDDTADFSRYKTFRMTEGDLKAKGPALNNDLIRKKIEEEIRKRLMEKGLREVSAQPDLNVRFSLTTPRRNEVEAYPAGTFGRATRRVKVQYIDGTLAIDLRDTKQRALVWKAVAVQSVDQASKLTDHLEDMVKKSIDKYPPKKK
jgi:hypothetical protein